MTVKSRTTLASDIATNLPDNTAGAITPQIMRNILVDLVDSALNIATITGASGAQSELSLRPGVNVQAYNDLLQATSALTGTGIICATSTTTAALRNLAVGTGLSVTNPAGVAGNPTINLAAFGAASAGAAGAIGAVPAPAAGDQGKFLRGDATWQAIAGSGTVTNVATDSTLQGGAITTTGTLGIANNVDLPGTGSFLPVKGTTAQRTSSPAEGKTRWNSDLHQLESFYSYWRQYAEVAEVDARLYGAIPDAKVLTDIVCTSGTATATSASAGFTSAINGKAIKIYDYVNAVYAFRGTATYVNSTTITLSANASASVSSGNGIAAYGTDNSAAIQAAITAADAIASDIYLNPNTPSGQGVVRVTLPCDARGDAYLCYSAALTVSGKNVCIDADAMLINAVANSASDRTWLLTMPAGGQVNKLRLEAMGGMGVKIGTASTNSQTMIGDMVVWTGGTNYNAGLTGQESQKCLEMIGYDFFINRLWTKGGNIGTHVNNASDVIANHIFAIGASTGVQLTSSEQSYFGNIEIDTGSYIGVTIDGSRKIHANIHCHSVNATGLTKGVQIGGFDTTNINRNLFLTVTGQRCGGTLLDVAYTEDSTIFLNASNAGLYSGGGVAITTALNYGSGNAGALSIHAVIDGAITTAISGTVYGHLIANVDGVINHYGTSHKINSSLELTGAFKPKTRLVTAAGGVTVGSTDNVVVIRKTTGAATAVTLSQPSGAQHIIIKDGKGDANTNNITITPTSSTIDGAGTLVINTAYGKAELVYEPTDGRWYTV